MILQSYSWAYYLEKTIIQKDTCTPMFIIALFTIARTWKQLKCPSTEEWIKIYVVIYTMQYMQWNIQYSVVYTMESVSSIFCSINSIVFVVLCLVSTVISDSYRKIPTTTQRKHMAIIIYLFMYFTIPDIPIKAKQIGINK